MSWNPNQPQPGDPNPYQQQPQSGDPLPYQSQPQPGESMPYQQQPQPGVPSAYPPQTPLQGSYTPQPGAPNPYQQQPSSYPPQPVPGSYEQPGGGMPPGYGVPLGYPNIGYGAAPAPVVPATPLPLGKALQGLPNQYIKILTKPGAQSFAEEQGKAEWSIILMQLLIAGLVGTIVGLIRVAVDAANVSSSFGGTAGNVFASFGFFFTGIGAIFSLISVTIGFFVTVGVQYILAKAFKGNGDFEQQGYNYLLIYTPITIINSVLGLIPYLGYLIVFATSIYGLVLNIFAIMATHRLSGGKATGVVLIPIGAVILLSLLCILTFVVFFASLYHSVAPTPYPSY
jgi:hypothetical protein